MLLLVTAALLAAMVHAALVASGSAPASAPVAVPPPSRHAPTHSLIGRDGTAVGISALSTAQITAFAPYTHFASTAYCAPATTRVWDCGANCDANPTFEPVAAGGDGAVTQFWFVGFDPALGEVIVSHQGTDVSKILADLTDADFVLTPLNATLFPGIDPNIRVHNGFMDTHARSAPGVLAAVGQAMSQFGTSKVTVVGHSLGAAIALLDSVFLPLHLPSSTTVRFVGYGLPRVGNQAFADFVDGTGRSVTHINNKEDPVPIVPPISFGFHHPSGEVHIEPTGDWDACPGQDNPSILCSTGSTTLVTSNVADHLGPYDGIFMGC